MKAITRIPQLISYVGILLIFMSSISCHHKDSAEETLAIEAVDLDESYKSLEDEETVMTTDDASNVFIQNSEAITTANIPKDLKIIKTASARYQVEDLDSAMQKIKELMYMNDGYLSELRYDKQYHQKRQQFTIKIPKEHFDTILDEIHELALETDYVTISTTDVTEKYVDAQSRLETKKEVKERLEKVLRNNAKTIKDILATEENLRVIQEEIEAAQGKLKYMSSRVAYSTVQIEIYEEIPLKDVPEIEEESFGKRAITAFSTGWNFIKALGIGIIYMWPLFVVALIVWFIFRRFRSKK